MSEPEQAPAGNIPPFSHHLLIYPPINSGHPLHRMDHHQRGITPRTPLPQTRPRRIVEKIAVSIRERITPLLLQWGTLLILAYRETQPASVHLRAYRSSPKNS